MVGSTEGGEGTEMTGQAIVGIAITTAIMVRKDKRPTLGDRRRGDLLGVVVIKSMSAMVPQLAIAIFIGTSERRCGMRGCGKSDIYFICSSYEHSAGGVRMVCMTMGVVELSVALVVIPWFDSQMDSREKKLRGFCGNDCGCIFFWRCHSKSNWTP